MKLEVEEQLLKLSQTMNKFPIDMFKKNPISFIKDLIMHPSVVVGLASGFFREYKIRLKIYFHKKNLC